MGVLRDPLFHFLGIGAALFGLFAVVAPEPERDSHQLVVDDATLLQFVQLQSKSFNVAAANARLAMMSPEEFDRTVADFIREEVLHREALAMGLDRDDYVIRRRLGQKLEFVAEGSYADTVELTDEAIAKYYEGNLERYRVEPRVTFTHVFFRSAGARADAAGAMLRDSPGGLARVTSLGDRFLYQRNYVDSTRGHVESHFGPEAARRIFSESPVGRWHGPIKSEHGAHLVMVSDRLDARTPPLLEIRGRVAEDAKIDTVKRFTRAAIDRLVEDYQVEVTAVQPQPSGIREARR